jgi:hypothetical protein
VEVKLKGDILQANGFDGLTAWDREGEEDNKEILENLWCWCREVQLNLKADLLLAKARNALTVWDIVGDIGNKDILETLGVGVENCKYNSKMACC